MNMDKWMSGLVSASFRKPVPVLSFPSVQLMGVTVRDLISDSGLQARGMKAVADRTPLGGASVSLMDLSVEAECFGAPIRVTDDEVPTCAGAVIDPDLDEDEHLDAAAALKVPSIGSGRTRIYIDAIGEAVSMIKDRPVLAGVIGPFSLAGRLVDVINSLIFCMTEEEYMHMVIDKATAFIIDYIKAFKDAGADGVVMAEPLAGLLSPVLAEEFSGNYCRRIASAVKDENFAFIYHNCGNTANITLGSIFMTGASAYHFGNAVNMREILEKAPSDVVCMGNVDPAGQFRHGTPESVKKATFELLKSCGAYKNFVLSSGCDIPPLSPWENIDAFYEAAAEYYSLKG